jgi:nucleoside-diphosphate-sugar epimerase
MNIFVTGATGLIGTELVNELVTRGHRIHFLSRDPLKDKYFKNKNVKFFLGDIVDKVSVEKAMTGCNYVFHLAGCTKIYTKKPENYYKINVKGTDNVLKTAQKLRIKKIIVTSTVGILGPSTEGLITEKTQRKIDYFNEYERTKSQAEKITLENINRGQNIIIVYPTRVYGPGRMTDSNTVTRLIKQYSEGRLKFIPGNVSKIGNYVYIDDVVLGHILALEKGKSGEKFILGGYNASNTDLFRTIDNILNRNFKIIRVPVFCIFIYSWVHVIISNLLGKPPRLTPAWVKRYLHNWSVSSEKAKRELGYNPTPLKTGIKNTLKWLEDF